MLKRVKFKVKNNMTLNINKFEMSEKIKKENKEKV
jgi:hypothetical protein